MSRALLTGIGGQDGSYLAELLLGHGYDVYGTVLGSPERYETLDTVRNRITFLELDLTDGEAVVSAIRELRPDETYHLASVSFVPASWEDPVGTSAFAAASTAALLEGLRREHPEGRFLNAASGEIFGAPEEVPQNERTPVAPITPYGAGKAFAHFLTGAFRRHYGLHASSAILFNHESPRRPEQFLTRKVSRGAAAISLGLEQELRLGDLSAQPRLGLRRRLRACDVDDPPGRRAGRLRRRDGGGAHRRGVRRRRVRRMSGSTGANTSASTRSSLGARAMRRRSSAIRRRSASGSAGSPRCDSTSS